MVWIIGVRYFLQKSIIFKIDLVRYLLQKRWDFGDRVLRGVFTLNTAVVK